MRKAIAAGLAALLISAVSVPAFAHHSQTTTQCSGSGVCMVNGVCNGSCTGTGDCAGYSGCKSTCTGAESCVKNQTCTGHAARGCQGGGGHHGGYRGGHR